MPILTSRRSILLGAAGAGLASACATSLTADEAAQLRAMRTLIDVHNTLETDKLDAIMVEDFIRVAPDENTQTRAEYKQFLRDFHGLFSDFHMEIVESAVGRDGGFIQWSVQGMYTGPGAAPTGSPIDVTGLAHYQFKAGKMTREFIGFNPGWFQEQLPARG